MKKNNGIAAFALTFIFIMAFSSQCLSSSDLKTIHIYKNSIDEEIARCQAKVRYIASGSNNLRQYCQRELQKAEFLSKAKEMLLREMVDNQIDVKEYKIRYFLNTRFYETVSE